MEEFNFNEFNKIRKLFLSRNKENDHTVLLGSNNILISAPHGVRQMRLGKPKLPETGSIATALYLQNKTNSFLIAKTKFNNDDANFDQNSSYRDTIRELVKKYNIKYLIDFHGLAPHWGCHINLGTNLGTNTHSNINILNDLNQSLINNGFIVSIDFPYKGGENTISGSFSQELNIWTIQIEIRCDISNLKDNFNQNYTLLKVLENWLNSIGN